MSEIQDLITFLQVLIPAGVILRTIYCCAAVYANDEEEKSYKARIKNALVFVVLAETISGLLKVIIGYF